MNASTVMLVGAAPVRHTWKRGFGAKQFQLRPVRLLQKSETMAAFVGPCENSSFEHGTHCAMLLGLKRTDRR